MKLKLIAVVALVAVGVGALAYTLSGGRASAATATEYLTSPATVGDVTHDIAATGTLQPEARYGVAFGVDAWLVDESADAPASPAAYPVTAVEVEVGDAVAAGDLLATADAADLQADLTAARYDVLAAENRLRIAEDELEAAEDDDDTDRIRQGRISRYDAINGLAAAEAAATDLEAQIAGATLVAPVAGTVTEVGVRPGFDAPNGAAIVIDAPVFQVTTDVVESDLVDVRVGQTALVTIDAVGASAQGTVTAVAPVASADSGSGVVSYPVTVTLADADIAVRSGMSAEVTITIASATGVLTVPSAALQGTEGDYRVRVVAADGTLSAIPVGVGLVTSSMAEITSGLTAGTEVVIGTAADLLGTDATTGFPGGGGVVVNGGGAIPGGGLRPGPGGGD